MRWRRCLLILGLGLILAGACNWNRGDRKLRVENGKGEAVIFVQGFDSLLVALHGVHPRRQYDFTVTLGGMAWALLIFFLVALIAFVIVKKKEAKPK